MQTSYRTCKPSHRTCKPSYRTCKPVIERANRVIERANRVIERANRVIERANRVIIEPAICHVPEIYTILKAEMYLCRHAWADLKHHHALYHSKIPAGSAISTSYKCYFGNQFKSVFRTIKPEILHHSP